MSKSSNAGLGSTGRRDCALGTEGDEVRRAADALGVDGSYLATSIVTKKEDIWNGRKVGSESLQWRYV